MASLFDTLQANAFRAGVTARSRESRKWFQKNVEKLKMPSRNALLKDDALDPASKTMVGSMYMYFYDPKHKKTLPYYDRFPLTIMIDKAPGGFVGLNLHYLRPDIRASFLDELMKLAPSKVKNNTRLMKLRMELLASTRKYKEFKPCYKHYLTSKVASRLVRVPMTEWEIAIFLPTEQFKKSSKTTVWKDSIKIARQK